MSAVTITTKTGLALGTFASIDHVIPHLTGFPNRPATASEVKASLREKRKNLKHWRSTGRTDSTAASVISGLESGISALEACL